MCRFRVPCIAAFWTLAVTLVSVSLIQRNSELGDLAILIGLVGCIPSGWLIVDHVVERAKQEAVLSVCEAIGYAEADGKLSHLR